MRSLQSVLAQNRADEFDFDVWEKFVIPPFYDRLDLSSTRKAKVIVGGRGCGKTMLLRYLSHQSQFSPKRSTIPDETLAHIGLYWRADTQFSDMMTARGVEPDVWKSAFRHMIALSISYEIISSLYSIARSASSSISEDDIERISFVRLRAFDAAIPERAAALQDYIEEQQWSFQAWVSDVRRKEAPTFLPGDQFVRALIGLVKTAVPAMASAVFFAYVDEYENLLEYQQRVINTWLKHSGPPLVFNLAMKRNAFRMKGTVGPESLVEPHDYRSYDLEQAYEEAFPVFAAEIFLSNVAREPTRLAFSSGPIQLADLRNPDKIRFRREDLYKKEVLATVRKIFPSLSHAELAADVIRTPVLSRRLQRRIGIALRNRGAESRVSEFWVPELAEAMIVLPALLSRRRADVDMICAELIRLQNGDSNRFTGTTGWIHNNLVGSMLQLYEPNSQASPLFAGFDTFCKLAHSNVRHFLELCYRSVTRMEARDDESFTAVPAETQAEAAREASSTFLREVREFGAFGDRLHGFVLALGSVFQRAHSRVTQSESEQNHFSILDGSVPLTPEDRDFLAEAVKWSVLYEEPSTKRKASHIPEGSDYVLNPIYAPFFNISYRKKRKLEISSDDLLVLIRGSISEVAHLLRRLEREWAIVPDESPTLFSSVGVDQ